MIIIFIFISLFPHFCIYPFLILLLSYFLTFLLSYFLTFLFFYFFTFLLSYFFTFLLSYLLFYFLFWILNFLKIWDCVILDEAHTVRNPLSSTAKAIFKLKAKCRIALSGTPIQNHVRTSVLCFICMYVHTCCVCCHCLAFLSLQLILIENSYFTFMDILR